MARAATGWDGAGPSASSHLLIKTRSRYGHNHSTQLQVGMSLECSSCAATVGPLVYVVVRSASRCFALARSAPLHALSESVSILATSILPDHQLAWPPPRPLLSALILRQGYMDFDDDVVPPNQKGSPSLERRGGTLARDTSAQRARAYSDDAPVIKSTTQLHTAEMSTTSWMPRKHLIGDGEQLANHPKSRFFRAQYQNWRKGGGKGAKGEYTSRALAGRTVGGGVAVAPTRPLEPRIEPPADLSEPVPAAVAAEVVGGLGPKTLTTGSFFDLLEETKLVESVLEGIEEEAPDVPEGPEVPEVEEPASNGSASPTRATRAPSRALQELEDHLEDGMAKLKDVGATLAQSAET